MFELLELLELFELRELRRMTSDRRGFRSGEPFFLQWHITDRCNLSCGHCYRQGAKTEPSLADLRAVWENLLDLRRSMPQDKARVQLAGGEPMLSPHLFTVLDWAAEAGLQARMLSNGTLIDRKAAGELKAHACSIVQLSLEGMEDAHDAVRGEGTFEKVLEAARCLREAGVGVTFAVTLTKASAADLAGILALAERFADRLGFHRLVPCGSGKAMKDSMLSPAELKKSFDLIHGFKAEHPKLDIPLRDPLWKPFFRCAEQGREADGCSAGYCGICVDADAAVYACRRMPIPLGSALKTPLAELWESPEMEALRDRDRLKGWCGRCPLRWRCGGCRAIGWALTDDPMAEDPQCSFRPGLMERLGWKALSLAAEISSRQGGG
ncbi:MAG: radical SAM protein [Elusimicrobia bacterium]|nr:radical SAM protein [Elusimicrobiota bacterium]